MAAFSTFNNRLPDPTFGVNDAGAVDAAGSLGPGFMQVTVTGVQPTQLQTTISGRGVNINSGAHHWEIGINYNPIRRDQFDVVASFLESRNSRLNPFFVVLPQYSAPKDLNFATFVTNNQVTVTNATSAGSQYMLIGAATAIIGTAKPGDFFTITDPNDTNHVKVYKVTMVETPTTYYTPYTAVPAGFLRIHFNPPLTRFTSAGSVVNFIDPAFRVIQKDDTFQYQLGVDNLYQIQLQLQEILP